MNKDIVETTLRLNLGKDDERKAWEYLKSRDKKIYKSYSKTVVIAVNDYFDRQKKLTDDPYLETREKEDAFLKNISDIITSGIEKYSALGALGGLLQLLGQKPETSETQNRTDEADAALDFADSF